MTDSLKEFLRKLAEGSETWEMLDVQQDYDDPNKIGPAALIELLDENERLQRELDNYKDECSPDNRDD